MKQTRKIPALFLAFLLLFLSLGCAAPDSSVMAASPEALQILDEEAAPLTAGKTSSTSSSKEKESSSSTAKSGSDKSSSGTKKDQTDGEEQSSLSEEQQAFLDSIEEEESYSSRDEVAAYLYLFGHLPVNYLTKSEAQDLGWVSSKGNLWKVAPGMSIGGDKFGNREGLLPTKKGRQYYECDIDYAGGTRNAKRIIFSNDGLVYYTDDHYESFTLLYDENGPAVITVTEDGEYSSKEEVAAYLHEFGHLPDNYLTKSEAQDLGWVSSKGNLWEVAPGMSIGGDSFGNREGLLPSKKGRKYYECDIDYEGGRRNAKRIIFSNDGLIYYTEDHYESFELLYGEE